MAEPIEQKPVRLGHVKLLVGIGAALITAVLVPGLTGLAWLYSVREDARTSRSWIEKRERADAEEVKRRDTYERDMLQRQTRLETLVDRLELVVDRMDRRLPREGLPAALPSGYAGRPEFTNP